MFKLLVDGGILMFPIVFASFYAGAIIIERYRNFRTIRNEINDFSAQAIEALKSERTDIAISLCERKHSNILSPILRETITNRDLEKPELEKRVSEVAQLQMTPLEKNMSTLSTISSVAPLLGLLGTVTGMIGSFGKIATGGVGNPELLADGISQALVTTAAGLFVAIPALVFFNYLNSKIDEIVVAIEKNCRIYINQVKERLNSNEAAA